MFEAIDGAKRVFLLLQNTMSDAIQDAVDALIRLFQ